MTLGTPHQGPLHKTYGKGGRTRQTRRDSNLGRGKQEEQWELARGVGSDKGGAGNEWVAMRWPLRKALYDALAGPDSLYMFVL